MATAEETILAEIRNIKADIIEIQTAIQNLASKQQLRQIVAIRQQEITELTQRVADIEQSIEILQRS